MSRIQAECLCRVLYLRIGLEAGSAFTYEKNGVQFLFTAKHLFKPTFDKECKVALLLDEGWEPFDANVFYCDNTNADIAVIRFQQQQNVTPHYEGQQFGTRNIVWGQDVFFLGFPLGFPFYNNVQVTSIPDRKIPVPFIKKASLSAMGTGNDGSQILYLDGYNNPGFSGGPVCFRTIDQSTMAIAGVVSGYLSDTKTVYDSTTGKPQATPNGHLCTHENTGIIIAYDIKHAIDIVDKILC